MAERSSVNQWRTRPFRPSKCPANFSPNRPDKHFTRSSVHIIFDHRPLVSWPVTSLQKFFDFTGFLSSRSRWVSFLRSSLNSKVLLHLAEQAVIDQSLGRKITLFLRRCPNVSTMTLSPFSVASPFSLNQGTMRHELCRQSRGQDHERNEHGHDGNDYREFMTASLIPHGYSH